MPSSPMLSRALRPAAFACLTGLATLSITACGTRPPAADPAPAPSLAERRAAVLRQYGFQPTDAGWKLQLSGKLLFGFDTDRLDDGHRQTLERMGRALAEVGIDTLRIEGHTDDQGSAAYNDRLSLRRAQAVAGALAASGIPADRIAARGHGSARPVAPGTSEDARRKNRRVSVVVPAQ